jgi:putative ABC transport system substrate-binding protein
MTDRRMFISGVSLGLLATALAEAQRAGKTYQIGYLWLGPRPADSAPGASLRQALQELGYAEGKNVIYVGRWAEGKRERLAALAAELVDLNVDVIITVGAPATEAAKAATSTIPVVMAFAADPVGLGLIGSLARPGGNITGVNDQAIELSAKRLEILKEAVPTAAHIAVLWNAQDRAMTLRYGQIEKAARVLGVTVEPLGVREPDDFDRAFATMGREHPDAFFMVTDSLTRLNRKRVLDFAETHRIPAMYEYAFLVRDGGLVSYGPDRDEALRRAAVYVDRIFKGAKPSELPVEQPTRHYLVVNVMTAKALGTTIPQSVLLRADEVIQ